MDTTNQIKSITYPTLHVVTVTTSTTWCTWSGAASGANPCPTCGRECHKDDGMAGSNRNHLGHPHT